MQDPLIDLLSVTPILKKRIWHITFFVFACTVAATIISFLLPKKYLATATCIPTNPALTDKAYIFNPNIQSLYGSLGGSNEMDNFISTAQSDTVLHYLVDKYHLADVYRINPNNTLQRYYTLEKLKKNITILKGEGGNIKISILDISPKRAADMANDLMQQTNMLLKQMMNQSNYTIFTKIKEDYKQKEIEYKNLSDSISKNKNTNASFKLLLAQQNSLFTQLETYQTLLSQFKLMTSIQQDAVLVQEYATPPLMYNKPIKKVIVIITALLSLLFGILLALLFHKKQPQ